MNRFAGVLRRLFASKPQPDLGDCGGCATYRGLPMLRSRSGALRLRDGRWIDLGAPELLRVHDALDGAIDAAVLGDQERIDYEILRRLFGPEDATPTA